MQRSALNRYLKNAVTFMREMHFLLPPFAYWTPTQWQEKGAACNEIREAMLGWDITDFGSGDFEKVGLLLFTLRNGSASTFKPYAEKIMIVEEGQVTPCHFHYEKQEDIINRGGGTLAIQLYNSTPEEELADTDVTVVTDGTKRTLPAGTILRLAPGESVTITRNLYHSFWAENGRVLAGEVSMTNDDRTDNRFLRQTGRFPKIQEDEPPLYLLVTEYPAAKEL